LLVPSFSTKAIRAITLAELHARSHQLFKQFAYQFQEAFLISAYDYEEGYIPRIEAGDCDSFVFIDSGGYETSTLEDVSEIYQSFPPKNDWDVASQNKVLDAWPEAIPAVFVNHDSGKLREGLEEQFDKALAQKSSRPNQLWTILLKPETHGTTLAAALGKLDSFQSALKAFDIIGVTEKEIGRSAQERIANVALLRKTLDDLEIPAPIHVFGSLDPTTVKLYALAGAEIFDGLSWLRFAFRKDGCSYLHEEAIRLAPLLDDEEAHQAIFARNVLQIQNLQTLLRKSAQECSTDNIPLSEIEGKLLSRALRIYNS
jgi:hypothetical protein